ncbi:hypothetical protein IAR50_005598 [Cryptococcus sp. DSM 104548]
MVIELWLQVKKDSSKWDANKHDKASIDKYWSVHVSAYQPALIPRQMGLEHWKEIGFDYMYALARCEPEKPDTRGMVSMKALGNYPEMARSQQPEIQPSLDTDVHPSGLDTGGASGLVKVKTTRGDVFFFVPYTFLAGQKYVFCGSC